jgi:hypothetical protein
VIGVLILSHYRLADEFVAALRHIVGELSHVRAIGLDPASAAPEEMRAQIDKGIREIDTGRGVLVLVDMFGGKESAVVLSLVASLLTHSGPCNYRQFSALDEAVDELQRQQRQIPPPTDIDPKLTEEFRRLEQHFCDAILHKDAKILDHLVGAEFTLRVADIPQSSLPRAIWMDNTLNRRKAESCEQRYHAGRKLADDGASIAQRSPESRGKLGIGKRIEAEGIHPAANYQPFQRSARLRLGPGKLPGQEALEVTGPGLAFVMMLLLPFIASIQGLAGSTVGFTSIGYALYLAWTKTDGQGMHLELAGPFRVGHGPIPAR